MSSANKEPNEFLPDVLALLLPDASPIELIARKFRTQGDTIVERHGRTRRVNIRRVIGIIGAAVSIPVGIVAFLAIGWIPPEAVAVISSRRGMRELPPEGSPTGGPPNNESRRQRPTRTKRCWPTSRRSRAHTEPYQ